MGPFERGLSEAETSGLGRYLERVRELHVSPIYASNETGWENTALSRCSKHLTGLKTISVEHDNWNVSLDTIVESPPNLVRLILRNVMCKDALQLYRFMASFPGLSILNLDSIRLQSTVLPSQISAAPFRLSHLGFDSCGDDETCRVGDLLVKAGALRKLMFLKCSEMFAMKALTEGIDDLSLKTVECTVDGDPEGLCMYYCFFL